MPGEGVGTQVVCLAELPVESTLLLSVRAGQDVYRRCPARPAEMFDRAGRLDLPLWAFSATCTLLVRFGKATMVLQCIGRARRTRRVTNP